MTESPLRPDGDAEPVFTEPWQAQAFALVNQLVANQQLQWADWTAHFSECIRADENLNGPDDGTRYYEIWLIALESLVKKYKWLDSEDIDARKQDWHQAYLDTPHGKPVKLKS